MTWSWPLAVAILVCAAHAGAADLGTGPDAALAADMVAGHNAVRAQVGAPPVRWDEALARQAMGVAQDNLARQELEHSLPQDRPGQGENLAAVFGDRTGAKSLLALWAQERRRYAGGAVDCEDEASFEAYGHYTQMIWRGTTRIGCAIASGANGQVLACRYAPAGNICGFRPDDASGHLAALTPALR